MNEEKAYCRSQLKTLGVEFGEMGLTVTRLIATGETDINGNTFRIFLSEKVGKGIQIRREDKRDVCLIPYESMVKMANAMGLFDDNEEENHG